MLVCSGSPSVHAVDLFGPTAARIAVGDLPTDVTVGDFNGDGVDDLAVADFQAGSVGMLLGDGLGGFDRKPDVPVGAGPLMLCAGDFNGDGALDMATAN